MNERNKHQASFVTELACIGKLLMDWMVRLEKEAQGRQNFINEAFNVLQWMSMEGLVLNHVEINKKTSIKTPTTSIITHSRTRINQSDI